MGWFRNKCCAQLSARKASLDWVILLDCALQGMSRMVMLSCWGTWGSSSCVVRYPCDAAVKAYMALQWYHYWLFKNCRLRKIEKSNFQFSPYFLKKQNLIKKLQINRKVHFHTILRNSMFEKWLVNRDSSTPTEQGHQQTGEHLQCVILFGPRPVERCSVAGDGRFPVQKAGLQAARPHRGKGRCS